MLCVMHLCSYFLDLLVAIYTGYQYNTYTYRYIHTHVLTYIHTMYIYISVHGYPHVAKFIVNDTTHKYMKSLHIKQSYYNIKGTEMK